MNPWDESHQHTQWERRCPLSMEGQEARWGGAGKQLKGCVSTTRIQPGSPAALLHSPPPSSSASCPQQLCPQALCCGTPSPCGVSPRSQPHKDHLCPKGQFWDRLWSRSWGFTCKGGGGGKATLTQQCGFLTLGFALIQADTRTAPSP